MTKTHYMQGMRIQDDSNTEPRIQENVGSTTPVSAYWDGPEPVIGTSCLLLLTGENGPRTDARTSVVSATHSINLEGMGRVLPEMLSWRSRGTECAISGLPRPENRSRPSRVSWGRGSLRLADGPAKGRQRHSGPEFNDDAEERKGQPSERTVRNDTHCRRRAAAPLHRSRPLLGGLQKFGEQFRIRVTYMVPKLVLQKSQKVSARYLQSFGNGKRKT